MSSFYIVLPLAGAVIGWLIMSIALWLIFRSIPKRKPSLDRAISKLATKEFISFEQIEAKLVSPESFQKILPSIEQHIDDFLKHKLTKSMPMLSMFIGEKTINQLKSVFMEELAELFPTVMKNYVGSLQQEINLEGVLYAKLAEIPSERIESALKELFAKEWKWLRMMGAIIGLVTSLIILLLSAWLIR